MIFLRELSKEDVPLINIWRNDEELVRHLGSPFRFVNEETDQHWFENYMKNRHFQVRCSICLAENQNMIGVVYLTQIDWHSRSAEFSIMIGDRESQDKGIGTLATRKMLEHAFHNLNLHRVYLTLLETNVRAMRVYEKVGFVKEGIMRQALYKNGEYQNLMLMGVLSSEYEQHETR